MPERTLTLDLPDEILDRLERLVEAFEPTASLDQLVALLLDHVQQGIYRTGSWERAWLERVVGAGTVADAYDPSEDPANR